MCLIIIGKTSEINELNIKKAWSANPDGAGVVIPHKKHPIAINGIMRLDHLYRVLRQTDQDRVIAVHLRLATHGSVSRANTHPHRVGRENAWILHNGVIQGLGSSGTGRGSRSDSKHLAEILGEIKSIDDRLALLRAIGGRYAYIDKRLGDQIVLVGDYAQRGDLRLSNTYWEYSGDRTTTTGSITPWQWDARSNRWIDNIEDWDK